MAARQAQPQLAGVGDDAGGDVEEGEAKPFAATAAELSRQGESLDPAGNVVGQGGGVPPQPVAEEVLQRGVLEPEVGFQLADGVFGDAARSRWWASTISAGPNNAGMLVTTAWNRHPLRSSNDS